MRTALTCLLLGVLILGCGASVEESLPRLSIGSRVPELVLPAVEGGELDLRSLAGEVVVLNFWATWCLPCRREIPELVALADAGRAVVLGVALDEEGGRAVRPFVERHGISYPVLLGNREIFERFHGYTIPYTVVLDRSQQVLNIYRGPISRTLVEDDLQRLEDGA